MTERKKLEFISSVEIMNTPMKKQRFIVDGMMPVVCRNVILTAADAENVTKNMIRAASSINKQKNGKYRKILLKNFGNCVII